MVATKPLHFGPVEVAGKVVVPPWSGAVVALVAEVGTDVVVVDSGGHVQDVVVLGARVGLGDGVGTGMLDDLGVDVTVGVPVDSTADAAVEVVVGETIGYVEEGIAVGRPLDDAEERVVVDEPAADGVERTILRGPLAGVVGDLDSGPAGSWTS